MSDEMNVVVVNTGVANVRSVSNMLKRLKVHTTISDQRADIRAAEVLTMPKAGSFDACVDRLRRGSIFGVQFHPEKSHSFGLELFQNVMNYAASAGQSWQARWEVRVG